MYKYTRFLSPSSSLSVFLYRSFFLTFFLSFHCDSSVVCPTSPCSLLFLLSLSLSSLSLSLSSFTFILLFLFLLLVGDPVLVRWPVCNDGLALGVSADEASGYPLRSLPSTHTGPSPCVSHQRETSSSASPPFFSFFFLSLLSSSP